MSSSIRALVLLNSLNSLRKGDKMLGMPRIISLFPNSFKNSMKQEQSCKILYISYYFAHLGALSNNFNGNGQSRIQVRQTKPPIK